LTRAKESYAKYSSPDFLFLLLTVMLVAYLLVLAVEGMKQWFFRHFAAE
jgi:hypothetical protein